MTAAYRIRFTDALTDQNRDEFEMDSVSAEIRLSAAGQMSGSIPLVRGDFTTGGRIAQIRSCFATACYIYRNGSLWWDGLLRTKTSSCDTKGNPKVQLTGTTFEGYLDAVTLITDLAAMTGAEQLDIARSFLTHLQADPNANMRIIADALTSGVLRDRVLYLASATPSYLKMLSDEANLDNGFEFLCQATVDGAGTRTRRMRLGYPTITSTTVHRLDKPGPILAHSLPEDGSRSATYLQAIGSGAQSTVHVDAAAIAAGYPRVNKTTSYGQITDPAVLEAHAAADLAAARTPVIIPTLTIRLDGTDITPQSIGDQVRVRIVDETYPQGFIGTYRLVGMTTSLPQRGKAESCQLVLN